MMVYGCSHRNNSAEPSSSANIGLASLKGNHSPVASVGVGVGDGDNSLSMCWSALSLRSLMSRAASKEVSYTQPYKYLM
jgi:hypothetical protein